MEDQRTKDEGSSLVQIDHVVGRDRSLFRQAGDWPHTWLLKTAWLLEVKGQSGADPLPGQAKPAQGRIGEGRTDAASSSKGLGQQRVRDALSISQEKLQA